MFTRVVAARTKVGKASEFVAVIQEKILPLLEEQRGFVDAILLVSDTDLNQVLAISVWESKSAAEEYVREHSARIDGLLSHLVEGAPVCRTFDVATFSSRHLSTSRAA